MIAGSVIDEVRVVDERLRRLVSKHLGLSAAAAGGGGEADGESRGTLGDTNTVRFDWLVRVCVVLRHP